jgi:hypothetical protein
MEADWSVEIGPGLPSIEASWDGFVDLRASPHTINCVAEAAQHPALRDALQTLNAEDSPLITTKCDTWPLAGEEIDPYEFGATDEEAVVGFASYIDILDRNAYSASLSFHEQHLRQLTSHLRELDLGNCRVEFVVRAAVSESESGFGITLYAAGCGADNAIAYASWQAVLPAAVAATIAAATHPLHTGE